MTYYLIILLLFMGINYGLIPSTSIMLFFTGYLALRFYNLYLFKRKIGSTSRLELVLSIIFFISFLIFVVETSYLFFLQLFSM